MKEVTNIELEHRDDGEIYELIATIQHSKQFHSDHYVATVGEIRTRINRLIDRAYRMGIERGEKEAVLKYGRAGDTL